METQSMYISPCPYSPVRPQYTEVLVGLSILLGRIAIGKAALFSGASSTFIFRELKPARGIAAA